MTFKIDLQKQLIDLMQRIFYDDTTILLELNLLKNALKGKSGASDDFYEYYKGNELLKKDKELLAELNEIFTNHTRKAQNLIENLYHNKNTSTFKYAGNSGLHRYVNITSNDKEANKFRISCNVLPDKIDVLIEHLLLATFCHSVCCQNCKYNGKFKIINDKISCPNCNRFPRFSFKLFHVRDNINRTNVLRRDKITFYMKDKYSFNFVYYILKKLNHYFSIDTPLLMKEIVPGLGMAVEPTNVDFANLNKTKSFEKTLSYGQWITKILEQNLIVAVAKNKNLVLEVVQMLESGDCEDMKIRKSAFIKLAPMVKSWSELITNDSRVQRHINEISELHSEITHELG